MHVRLILGICLFPAILWGQGDPALTKALNQFIEASIAGDSSAVGALLGNSAPLFVDSERESRTSFLRFIREGASDRHSETFGKVLNATTSGHYAWSKLLLNLPQHQRVMNMHLQLIRLDGGWKIMALQRTLSQRSNAKGRILFVLSNAHNYGKSEINAANHFAEICLPYDELITAGYDVDFISPKGGAVPLGYISTNSATIKAYLYDEDFMHQLEHTLRPDQVDPTNYQAVYYSGGGAAMFGVHDNAAIQRIAMSIYAADGIVSAVCHGTAGIVDLRDTNDHFLVTGKVINGFPDRFENKEAAYYQTFPFSIEQAIAERGGQFEYSDEGWDGFYRVDGRIITGQDPSSARSVAKAIIAQLQEGDESNH